MPFETNVFINCPFDDDFAPLLQAILFCVITMGFEPRLATERSDSGETRLDKIRELRALVSELGLETIIEVDGGISAANARAVFDAGAEVLVAGSAVFEAPDPEAEIRRILEA